MKQAARLLLATVLLILVCVPAKCQYLGVTCGWNYSHNLEGWPNDRANTPLFNPVPSRPDLTWDDWAEELGAAGVDFVCPNLRGSYPNKEMSPVYIKPLLTALKNRSLDKRIKLAIFDDNAASWTAEWNQAHGRGFGYAQPFDISDPANWAYLWDYNYKLFYETVPDVDRFKIDGRPVIIIWSCAKLFVGNPQGNVSRALMYVRAQCRNEFGFNPFIIVSADFVKNDTTCDDPAVVDGIESWFRPSATGDPNGAFTLDTFHGVQIGAGCPGFQTPQSHRWVDPDHGRSLDAGLQKTHGAGALLTLVEGFTDREEDASLFRVRNLNVDCNPLGYADTFYDYPNQRLDILRKNSNDPYPADLKEEAEGCDLFGGGTGRSNNYRNGPISIEPTVDSGGGYDVVDIRPGEWLEWEAAPIRGLRERLQVRVAGPNGGGKLHFVIDGKPYPQIRVPKTGSRQRYVTVDDGHTYRFDAAGPHKVRIVCDTGGLALNYWQAHDELPFGKTVRLAIDGGLVSVVGYAALAVRAASTSKSEEFTVVDESSKYGYGAVALKSRKTGEYVAAGASGTSPPAADGAMVGVDELFLWQDQGDGTIVLRSLANSKIVSDGARNAVLLNDRVSIGTDELFKAELVSRRGDR